MWRKNDHFFGKRGINWHVSCVITKKSEGTDFDVNCYVHIFDTCSQDWFTVANIIENLLESIKKDNNTIRRIFLRSDNAGCYHNAPLLSALVSISKRLGLNICRYDFSDVQSGKDICDRKISPMKSHMKLWVNEKHNITNAEEMKEALDSHGGIKGCQIAVYKISKDRHETSAKWEGISLLNNFEFRDTEIRA